MGHFDIPDPMEESTTSLVSSSTSAYSSFPVDVVVYVRVQVIYFIFLFVSECFCQVYLNISMLFPFKIFLDMAAWTFSISNNALGLPNSGEYM